MTVTIITDMVSEPVSLTEAKAWMRIKDFTDDDALVGSLIESTRRHLERYTGLSFGTKTVETILDIEDDVELPYGPVQSVTSVYLRNGTAWEAVTEYVLTGSTLKVYGKGTYKVRYQAGYISCPDDLRTDIKVLTAWQYENRGLKLQTEKGKGVSEFPHWNLLNARLYKKIVI